MFAELIETGDWLREDLRLAKKQAVALQSELKTIYSKRISTSDVLKADKAKLVDMVRQLEAGLPVLRY